MSMIENIRARLEEVRTSVQTRLSQLRGGGGGQLLQGGISGQLLQGPIISEIREKGPMAVLEERFPKVKEIREKGIMSRLRGTLSPQAGTATTPSPPTKSPPVVEEKEARARGARILV